MLPPGSGAASAGQLRASSAPATLSANPHFRSDSNAYKVARAAWQWQLKGSTQYSWIFALGQVGAAATAESAAASASSKRSALQSASERLQSSLCVGSAAGRLAIASAYLWDSPRF